MTHERVETTLDVPSVVEAFEGRHPHVIVTILEECRDELSGLSVHLGEYFDYREFAENGCYQRFIERLITVPNFPLAEADIVSIQTKLIEIVPTSSLARNSLIEKILVAYAVPLELRREQRWNKLLHNPIMPIHIALSDIDTFEVCLQ